jgi:hypothetical protein
MVIFHNYVSLPEGIVFRPKFVSVRITPNSNMRGYQSSWNPGDFWTQSLYMLTVLDTLWLFNLAMENDPIIDDAPIKSDDFPWLCQTTKG